MSTTLLLLSTGNGVRVLVLGRESIDMILANLFKVNNLREGNEEGYEDFFNIVK